MGLNLTLCLLKLSTGNCFVDVYAPDKASVSIYQTCVSVLITAYCHLLLCYVVLVEYDITSAVCTGWLVWSTYYVRFI